MKKKAKTTTPAKPTCGVLEGGIGLPCELQPGHDGKHKNRRATFTDPPAKKPAKVLSSEEQLTRTHRRKQAEDRAEKQRAKAPKPPVASKYCDDRGSGTSFACVLPPGHDGDHSAGPDMMSWPQGAAAKAPSLADVCPKCGRELGEHAGKKCPPKTNVSKDRCEHVYSLIVGAADGVRADELASIHRGALTELERAGRITYRNERWYPAAPVAPKFAPLTLEDEPDDPEADAAAIAAMSDDDDRAARWACEASFTGEDGRDHECEARNEHNGPHYAYSNALRKIVHAAAPSVAQRKQDDEDEPEDYETRTDDDRELARQQREAREAHAREIEAAGEHDWEKSNLFTKHERGSLFDTYRCKKCGATSKRHGLAWPPKLDKKQPKKCPPKAEAKALESHSSAPVESPVAIPSPTASPRPIGATITCRGKVYPIHPAALIFPTPEEQYRKIVDSIRTQGQIHDVERLNDPDNDNPVIDGCSRLRACEELGIDPRVKFVNIANPIQHVIAVNLARRHLDESQRAMAANELATMEHGANQHSRTGKFAAPPTQAEAAVMLNVSERLVRDAARVKREGVPEVAAAIREGRIKVSAGAELAKLGPKQQREILDKVTKGKGEVKAGKVRALVKQEEKRAVIAKINKEQLRPMPLGPFRLIVADYPWPYDNSDQHDGSRGHITYPPMPLDDIYRHARDEIARVAHDDCILGLWVTNHFIHIIGRVIEAAGFDHRTMITWDKCHAGMGTWPRGQTEHLVIASRGNPIHTLNEITTLYREPPRPEHSRKPDGLMDLLAKHCPGPNLEMFARDEERPKWKMWGAEVGKFSTEDAA